MLITTQKGEYLDILLRSPKTVFTVKDVVLLWRDPNSKTVLVRLNYYAQRGKLIRLRRGIYAKDSRYNHYELAVNILSPAYISFETVLGTSGITFQYYRQIFIASYVKRDLTIDSQIYSYRTIDRNILINPAGIDIDKQYSIATKERAFLDTIYRSKEYHFDNLSPLNWDKVFEILPIYDNRQMNKRVEKYYQLLNNS